MESTTLAARLSNRLLMALARESENTEDVNLKKHINQSENKLKMVIAPFVESSKSMAINISDKSYYMKWKSAAASLLQQVQEVTKLFSDLQLHSPGARHNTHHQAPAPVNTKVPIIVEPHPSHMPAQVTKSNIKLWDTLYTRYPNDQ